MMSRKGGLPPRSLHRLSPGGKHAGTGFRQGKWTDVEVSHTELGAPVFVLHGWYKEAAAAISRELPTLSISHDGAYAIAQVVMEG